MLSKYLTQKMEQQKLNETLSLLSKSLQQLADANILAQPVVQVTPVVQAQPVVQVVQAKPTKEKKQETPQVSVVDTSNGHKITYNPAIQNTTWQLTPAQGGKHLKIYDDKGLVYIVHLPCESTKHSVSLRPIPNGLEIHFD